MPLELTSQTERRTGDSQRLASLKNLLSSEGGLRDRDRMLFTERLALLLETGVSLNQALIALKKQSDKAALETVIDGLVDEISAGRTFAAALAMHPQFFSTTYVNLVAAGEQGGFLHRVLQELLEMEEKREQLRSTLMSALSYPAFLAAFSGAVVVFVLVVVFPKFAELFASIADQLPVTTLALMWTSDQLRQHWIFVLLGAGGLVLAWRYWAGTEAGRERLDALKLSAPLVKDIFVWLYLVQSLRVLGLSLGNGVSIVDALAACRDVVRNATYRRFILGVERKIQEGATVASGFAQSNFIPMIVQQMITTGEQTGSLPKVMTRVADYYERELSKRANVLAKSAEPVMLLVMGVVVGLLVSSLILPIFKLSRAVY
ncbi:MAG: type II secretion system F family protein [Gammaproteobacteria bacterium]|nr:type II secretion system F family protein [Gammaproteobacteria bacterium]